MNQLHSSIQVFGSKQHRNFRDHTREPQTAAQDAEALLAKAKTMVVSKGKKVTEFAGGSKASEEAVEAMLGSTGNLRAPTAIVGKHILVGFNEDTYSAAFK